MKEEIEKAAKDSEINKSINSCNAHEYWQTLMVRDAFVYGANWMDEQYRKMDRQFKRALLKAWIGGMYYHHPREYHIYYDSPNWMKVKHLRTFINWYNKQNFKL